MRRRAMHRRNPKTISCQAGSALPAEPLHGVMDEGGAAFQMQLLFDLRAMHIHGSRADVKLAGDFVAGFSASDQLENLELAICERLEG